MLKHLILLSIAAAVLGSPRHFLRKLPLQGRIVGGIDADINDYPWQISLEIYGSHTCGGSIISENYIVTAAHCTYGSLASDFEVLVNTSIVGKLGTRVKIANIYQNPSFEYFTVDYDIAILKLSTPLELGAGVQPVKLPDENSTALDAGTTVTVTGWGTLSERGRNLSSQLQVVELNVVTHEECIFDYDNILYEITDQMFCAEAPDGGKDSCSGDSGGPVVVDGTLYGIVSWGKGCAEQDYPGVYSNVLSLRDYISKITGL